MQARMQIGHGLGAALIYIVISYVLVIMLNVMSLSTGTIALISVVVTFLIALIFFSRIPKAEYAAPLVMGVIAVILDLFLTKPVSALNFTGLLGGLFAVTLPCLIGGYVGLLISKK